MATSTTASLACGLHPQTHVTASEASRHHPAHRRLYRGDPRPEDQPSSTRPATRPSPPWPSAGAGGRCRGRRHHADGRGHQPLQGRGRCPSSWPSTRWISPPPTPTASSGADRARARPRGLGRRRDLGPVSAATEMGIDNLLEMILLTEMEELRKANPNRARHHHPRRAWDEAAARWPPFLVQTTSATTSVAGAASWPARSTTRATSGRRPLHARGHHRL